MSDINLQITIREESGSLFKRSVRKLLESTFVLREKDEKLYRFLARESNRQDVSEYLKMIGFDILVDDKTGLAMLTASEEDEETVGLKRANLITFTTIQYHLLLILWKIYLEHLGYDEGNFVTKGDLIDQMKAYGAAPVRTEFSAALKLFKKYSLIDYDENESGEEMKIRLYPSLQFGWDIPQFQTVAGEYLKESGEERADASAKEQTQDLTDFEEDEP